MTDTPKCGEGCTLPANHTGRCAPYGVCRCGSVFDGPARDNHNLGCPVSPDKGLDFEKAFGLNDPPSLRPRFEEGCAALNAQHLAALEGMRKEEREKAKSDGYVIGLQAFTNGEREATAALRQEIDRLTAERDALTTPTMWWNTSEESWYEEKGYALDDLHGGKVYEIHTARLLAPFFVVRKYDEAKDEHIDHEFPTRAEAEAALASFALGGGNG